MQPDYYKCIYKAAARQTNVEAYRRLSGRKRIPKNRSYWTLCNKQPRDDGSEIVQMQKEGLLTKSQFHGVDRDSEIIEQNKVWHPTANWHVGEWTEVIENCEFEPALIYLDTTNFADHWTATDTVVRTMMLCPPHTVLLANLLLNDPYSSKRFDPDKIIEHLGSHVPSMEIRRWSNVVESFIYSTTGKTYLITYILHKQS